MKKHVFTRSRVLRYGLLLVPLVAFYFALLLHRPFRWLVQRLYYHLGGGRIVFVGKNFQLFPSGGFVVATVLGCTALYLLLVFRARRAGRLQAALAILIPLLLLGVACYLDLLGKVYSCTACDDGVYRLPYNGIDYGMHLALFLGSACIVLLPGFRKRTVAAGSQPAITGAEPAPGAAAAVETNNEDEAMPTGKLIPDRDYEGPLKAYIDWVAGGNFDGYIYRNRLRFLKGNKVVRTRVIVDQSAYDGTAKPSEEVGKYADTDKNTLTCYFNDFDMRGKIFGARNELIAFDIWPKDRNLDSRTECYELR